MFKLFIGFLFSMMISFIARKKGALNFSGFIGAIFLGTALYFLGRFFLSTILIGFFVSSSLFTKYREKDKGLADDINEKSGARDYVQVIANGGLGLAYSFLYYFTGNPAFVVAFAAAFSAATADTWASELGVFSKSAPVSILTFRKAEAGTSGAISLLGTFSALCGSIFIAIIFYIGYIYTFRFDSKSLYFFFLVSGTGFLGSIFDSLLGATVQGKYQCPVCSKHTEKKLHHGTSTLLIRGCKWVNNDMVNFISCLFSSGIALFIAYSIS